MVKYHFLEVRSPFVSGLLRDASRTSPATTHVVFTALLPAGRGIVILFPVPPLFFLDILSDILALDGQEPPPPPPLPQWDCRRRQLSEAEAAAAAAAKPRRAPWHGRTAAETGAEAPSTSLVGLALANDGDAAWKSSWTWRCYRRSHAPHPGDGRVWSACVSSEAGREEGGSTEERRAADVRRLVAAARVPGVMALSSTLGRLHTLVVAADVRVEE